MKMKQLEILRITKCGRKHEVSRCCQKKMVLIELPDRVASNKQFVLKHEETTVSTKHNRRKTSYACIHLSGSVIRSLGEDIFLQKSASWNQRSTEIHFVKWFVLLVDATIPGALSKILLWKPHW